MPDAILSPEEFKELFLIEPGIAYLNHGSFGATPRAVFEEYQAWQLRLERQPVRFFRDEFSGRLAGARRELADYLNVDQMDLVFVPNATFGVNTAAHALPLGEGDEVLATDHEYGACDNVWRHLAANKGFSYTKACLPLPLATDQDTLAHLWEQVTERTRVIFLSHITSPTAQTFPVEAVCRKAREAGILTIVDGAHAPGQIPLDLTVIGADMYTGNLHKWLCSPKGAGFLHVRPEKQHLIEPPIVGWRRAFTSSLGSSFQDDFEYVGTADYSAFLSVPSAIRFQAEHNWPEVRRRCHELLARAIATFNGRTGRASAYASNDGFTQMAIVEIADVGDSASFQPEFVRRYRVEVPFTRHAGKTYARISVQAYNTAHDLEVLESALLSVGQPA
jgi:isopenicillin-N epimerase